MPKPNARLTLQLSPVTSNRDQGNYMSLVIADAVSGRRVADFELLAEHLLDLLGNRQVGGVEGVPAWLIEPRDRHVLGQHHFITSRRFSTHTHNDDTVERWAKLNAGAMGANKFRISKNNSSQHVVTFDYYATVDSPAALDELIELNAGAMDHLTPPAADR